MITVWTRLTVFQILPHLVHRMHHGTSLDWSPLKSDDFAHKCFNGSSHDSYLMNHTASDRGRIELWSVTFENMIFARLRARLHPRKTSKNYWAVLHTVLKTLIDIRMCRIKFYFISAISHPPTQWPAHAKLKKKTKIQFRAPFWKPILAKMKNSSKIDLL